MNLSGIITNGMVLQRNIENTIWGTVGPSLEVRISFLDKNYRTQSDSNGHWTILLDALEPGGPHQMILATASEETIIQNILIGDVWVLGGQSNMELPLRATLDLLSAEVESINHPFIRQFAAPQGYNFHAPQDNIVGGEWISASPRDVMDFSAAGFFFAKELYEKYGVPIGLLQTAMGGTPIEAWISEQTLRNISGYDAELEQNKDDNYVVATKQKDEEHNQNWSRELGDRDLGLQECWFQEGYDAASWEEFELPNSWADSPLESVRGAVFLLPCLKVMLN
jgi:sialate O-acetylesterase